MVEGLRKNPSLRLEGSRTVTLGTFRPPAKTLSFSLVVQGSLSGPAAIVAQDSPSSPAALPGSPQEIEKPQVQKAEPALQEKPVALVFGPAYGAVSALPSPSPTILRKDSSEGRIRNCGRSFMLPAGRSGNCARCSVYCRERALSGVLNPASGIYALQPRTSRSNSGIATLKCL